MSETIIYFQVMTVSTHLARAIRESCGTFLLEISIRRDFPLELLSVMPTLMPASTSKSGMATWVVKTFLFLLYFIVAVASVGEGPVRKRFNYFTLKTMKL